MKTSKISFVFAIVFALFTTIFISCEKDEHIPPTLEFKSGSGYTFSDMDSVGQNASVKVGVMAHKTEDELKTFNVSVAYDNASTTTTKQNTTLTSSQEEEFETDYTITTRAQAGVEKWSFTITDRDGNVTTKTITLNVK
jgi:hypothetical protein